MEILTLANSSNFFQWALSAEGITLLSAVITVIAAIVTIIAAILTWIAHRSSKELVDKITTVFGLYQYLEFVKSFYRRSSKRIISVQRIWHIDPKLREAIQRFANQPVADAKAIFCGPVDLEENIAGLFWRLHFVYCSGEITDTKKFEFFYDKTFDQTHDNIGKLRFTIADNNLLLASSLKPEQEVYGMPYEDEEDLANFYEDIFKSKIRGQTMPVYEKLVELIKERNSGEVLKETLVDSLGVKFRKNYLDKNVHIERHEDPPDREEFEGWVGDYLKYLATQVAGSGITYDATTDKFKI